MSHSTLHILSRASTTLSATLLSSVAANDALLLTGDGVYAALMPAATLPAHTLALRVDVEARGLLARWPEHIALTDHDGFVALCVQYTRSLAWN